MLIFVFTVCVTGTLLPTVMALHMHERLHGMRSTTLQEPNAYEHAS